MGGRFHCQPVSPGGSSWGRQRECERAAGLRLAVPCGLFRSNGRRLISATATVSATLPSSTPSVPRGLDADLQWLLIIEHLRRRELQFAGPGSTPPGCARRERPAGAVGHRDLKHALVAGNREWNGQADGELRRPVPFSKDRGGLRLSQLGAVLGEKREVEPKGTRRRVVVTGRQRERRRRALLNGGGKGRSTPAANAAGPSTIQVKSCRHNSGYSALFSPMFSGARQVPPFLVRHVEHGSHRNRPGPAALRHVLVMHHQPARGHTLFRRRSGLVRVGRCRREMVRHASRARRAAACRRSCAATRM